VTWTAPELVRRIAAARTRCHVHSKSNNQPPGDPNHTSIVGVSGEWLFAQEFKLPYTFAQGALQLDGDNGIDFTIDVPRRPKPLTIDVKTARKPTWLMVHKDKLEGRAEIFVLAKYDEELGPKLLGWEWRCALRREVPRHIDSDKAKSGGEFHTIEAEKLRPMEWLHKIIDSYKRRAA
jgi:hypothetical protein